MASAETILFEVEVQTDDTASQQLGEVDESVDSLEQSFQDLQKRSQVTAEQLENASVEASQDVRSSFERAEQELRQTGAAAERASTSTREVGSAASGTATNLGFELVQGAQDARFGLAGLANQIPLIQEQFLQLRQQSGSTTGALSSLAGAFTNPATGLVAAVTVLLTFKEPLLSFFSDVGDEAKTTEEKIKAAEEGVKQVAETAGKVLQGFEEEIPELQITDPEVAREEIDQLREVADARQEVIESARRLQTLRQDVSETDLRLARERDPEDFQDPEMQLAVQQAEELLRLEEELGDIGTLDRFIERQESQIEVERGIALQLEKQLENRKQQARVQERILQSVEGVSVAEEEEAEFAEPPEAPEQPEVLDATDEEQQITFDAKVDPPDEEELDDFDRVLGDVQDRISSINSRPFLSGAAAAEKRVQAVVQQIRSAQRAGRQFTKQEINDLIRSLDLAENEAKQVREALRGSGEAAKDTQEQVNQQLARSIRVAFRLGETLAQAFKKGDVEAQKLIGSILQIVGSAVATANPAAGAVIGGVGSLLQSFDEGGYTGSGAPDQVAGVVHRGEFVMPAQVVDELGVGTLRGLQAMVEGQMHVSKQDLRRMAGVPGFQEGGLVQPVTRHSPSASGTDVEAIAQQAADRASRQTAERVADSIADRPVIMKVEPRGARDIVETGQELQARDSPRET